jgi:hypothetical protein
MEETINYSMCTLPNLLLGGMLNVSTASCASLWWWPTWENLARGAGLLFVAALACAWALSRLGFGVPDIVRRAALACALACCAGLLGVVGQW